VGHCAWVITQHTSTFDSLGVQTFTKRRYIVERHRHRYEVNQHFREAIERGGLRISGLSPDKKLVEYVEAPACDYFIATQAHPEFRSRPTRAHPLFVGLIQSALKTRK